MIFYSYYFKTYRFLVKLIIENEMNFDYLLIQY